MGLLGTLLLLFLVMHISHNLFQRMVDVFQNPFIVLLYVIGCISLAYHLLHGFQSAFRTLGVHNTRYIGLVQGLGAGFSVIVPLIFALMPISIHFGWIG
jgi:succinate dehydrogenase / fumarate reductase cytochrome b subunit